MTRWRGLSRNRLNRRIASEAFVRLLSRWTRVQSPHRYLYMTAANLIRDHWRKAERERRALRSVTSRLRDPFLLCYYGSFGIRETAALLPKPEGTVKADLFAARAKLKTALGEPDD